MHNTQFPSSFRWVASTLIIATLIACIGRLFPHPYNFTPIGAMALFAGAYIGNKKWAIALPLLALLFTDIVLQISYMMGYSSYPAFYGLMPVVYGCLALTTVIGFGLARRNDALWVLGAGLTSSLLFFVFTNFAVWLVHMPKTWAAFVQCYTQAIPFFRHSLIGDLSYTVLFFGSYALARRYIISRVQTA